MIKQTFSPNRSGLIRLMPHVSNRNFTSHLLMSTCIRWQPLLEKDKIPRLYVETFKPTIFQESQLLAQ